MIIDELDRELATLEMQIEFRCRRIKELQELKRQAEKADMIIKKLRDEIADYNEEYHEKLRLYYSQT
ncbi:hypothetical protein BVF91_05950 [Thermoanaerobacterium sp. PSU-2]|uniref:hypothetical protein n=1 Tax=Thermoanaerobacterium sp. PSU-2 TaxID=1930849 RepID=UPI000A16586F|nr:hypothetical protein [Thermoanaerobacterium sp. PSU-2]ORX23372.1 hypothetical protein BVF91_05950 [Thermoanaerobacterium sp. PSU-2]HHV74882.1 HAD-IG family 5'-nucleotidase [Thermoanaerobacterium sp.]